MNFWGTGEFLFVVGLSSFLFGYKHYLSLLLSLELIMLSIYLMFCEYTGMWQLSGELVLLFLTMMVCEGAFGLCVLVSFSRSYGSDMMQLLNTL